MSEPAALSVMMRSNCGLCDHLVLALEILRPRYGFVYDKIDVDSDEALARRYGLRVPVLVDGDIEVCEGHCDPAVIEAHLKNH